MNQWMPAVVVACILVIPSGVCMASWDVPLFRDDFNAPGPVRPNLGDWVVNEPDSWWWTQGRTHFPCPSPWLKTGAFPRVEGGACIIEHHLYNPYDLANVHTTFMGGQIHTVLEFRPDRATRFEAKIRLRSDLPPPYIPLPNGLVAGFFVYGYDGTNSDEIDFEFLSNQVNDDVTYPNGDPVFLTTWNESFRQSQCECDDCVAPAGLDLTEWNTFRIAWYPDEARVEWIWVDRAQGEVLLHEDDTAFFVPDEPMAVFFNVWASEEIWPCAYDSSLEPVDDAARNAVCALEIDYVEVRATSGSAEGPGPWIIPGCGLGLMSLTAIPMVLLVSGLMKFGTGRRRRSPGARSGARQRIF